MDVFFAAGRHLRAVCRRVWVPLTAAIWVTAAVAGLATLWHYDNTPGVAAKAPPAWPTSTNLVRAAHGETLVMLAHPQCTCTEASLTELAEALARASRQPKTYVVFLKPSVFQAGWERTNLWRRAAQLPGATVVRDDDGVEAHGFGAATSGQTLLYDESGTLVFSGGITGSRAHEGDNAGRQSLVSLLNHQRASGAVARSTNVFGCPLFQASN